MTEKQLELKNILVKHLNYREDKNGKTVTASCEGCHYAVIFEENGDIFFFIETFEYEREDKIGGWRFDPFNADAECMLLDESGNDLVLIHKGEDYKDFSKLL